MGACRHITVIMRPQTENKKIHYFSVDTRCADDDLSVLICAV